MTALCNFAQDQVSSLEAKSVYYISIDINSNSGHPTMFDIILDNNDSLFLDIKDEHSFIKNALVNTVYVPRLWSYDVFRRYYNDIDVKDSFRNVFFDKLKKYGKKFTLTLKSGETVSISYFFLKGVFVQIKRQIVFSNGLNSEDNPKVSNPCIPFAMTEFNYVKDLPVKISRPD